MVTYTNEMMFKHLKKLLKKIQKEYEVRKMLLFGSRARGDYFLDSDVDIIIISPQFEGVFFTQRMANISEKWEGKVDIEPLCYTPEEFERKKKQIGIVKQAVKEGIEITFK